MSVVIVIVMYRNNTSRIRVKFLATKVLIHAIFTFATIFNFKFEIRLQNKDIVRQSMEDLIVTVLEKVNIKGFQAVSECLKKYNAFLTHYNCELMRCL